MFKSATRMKLRFSHKGSCSVEDLWDLPLTDLDKIYKSLSSSLQNKQGDSLLIKANKEDDVTNLKMVIVKDVFETINFEREVAKNKSAKAAKKQKLLEIIENKQDADLQNKSVEELTALVNGL